MDAHSRRTFLIGTGAGIAAGVGATALAAPALAAPAWPAAKPSSPDASAPADADADAPLVAYVRDVRTGEISLMAGDREVVITDRSLAARLARKMG